MIAAPPERGGEKAKEERHRKRERGRKRKKVVREITETPTVYHTKFNILACTSSKFQE
jgi:hypothetical protein